MAFNNTFNNNRNTGIMNQREIPKNSNRRNYADNESSQGIMFKNINDGRFIDFNYSGRNVLLGIGSTPPGSDITFMVKKNSQSIFTALSYFELNDLWDICEEVIESIKNSGTFSSPSIMVGIKGDAILQISNGSEIGAAPGIYLVLYKGLDAARRSNNFEVYPFKHTTVYRGYDHNTGACKEDISKVGEFKKFYRAVKEAAKAFSMAMAHSVKENMKADKLASFKALAAMTAKMGIDMSKELLKNADASNSGSTSQNTRNGYGGPRSFSNGANMPQNSNGVNQAYSSISDPIDVNLSMNDLTAVNLSDFK